MECSSPLQEPLERCAAEGSSNNDAAGEPASGDAYIALATREVEQGFVNRPLLVRALAASDGDGDAAREAYVRARAVELRLARRELARRAAARAPEAAPSSDAVVSTPAQPARSTRRVPVGTRARLYVAAGALVVGVAAAAVVFRGVDDDVARPHGAPSARSNASNAARAERAIATAASEDPLAALRAKVVQLSDAGNWNVLVLNALEWTRKEPLNADAWRHLAVGYEGLRQFDEALAAANKAASLAPNDASTWRTVGDIGVAASDPEVGAQAFERAVSLERNDVRSALRAGMLNLQLERPAQAAAAFDAALAAEPGNLDALCGQLSLARRQRHAKDADALAKQLAAQAARCADAVESAAVAVKLPAGRTTAALR